MEDYLLKLGNLRIHERVLLVIAGFLIALPVGIGVFSWWATTLMGVALALPIGVIIILRRKLALIH